MIGAFNTSTSSLQEQVNDSPSTVLSSNIVVTTISNKNGTEDNISVNIKQREPGDFHKLSKSGSGHKVEDLQVAKPKIKSGWI